MNYQKVYNQIIEKAKSENRKKLKRDNPNFIYYENHHILPKSLGGSNKKENLVLLTAKEHFVCHKLLVEFTEGQGKYKMIRAWHKMTYSKTKDQDRNYKITSNEYERLKILFAEVMSKREVTEQTKRKIAQTRLEKGIGKGKDHPMWGVDRSGKKSSMWGKRGKETGFFEKKHKRVTCPHCNKEVPVNIANLWHFDNCLNNPEANKEELIKNRQKSDYVKSILSKNASERTGSKNPMWGKTPSKDTIDKQKKTKKETLNKTQTICPWCGKEGSSIYLAKWHFDNCLENPNNDKEQIILDRYNNHPCIGKVCSEKTKEKQREIAKNRKQVTCPHCGKVCDVSNAKRWHFDNCKYKK